MPQLKSLTFHRTFVMLLALVLSITFVQTAIAQESIKNSEYKVEIKKPEQGWEEASGNEKAIAVFTHASTQSQIEIVPTKLMTADVADVFFSTFHKTLEESNFKKVEGQEKDETIGTVAGKHSVYKFTHSGVVLSVHVFGFVQDATAWLVVGYMQSDDEANVLKSFNWTIENMKFEK